MERRDFIPLVCCFIVLFLATFNIVIISCNLGSIQARYGVDDAVMSAFSEIGAISYVVFFMVSVAITDKFGKKKSLIAGLSIFAVTSVLCAVAWDMISLMIFRIIAGLSISLMQTSCSSIMVDLTPKKYLGEATAMGFSFSCVGAIIAPMIGYGIIQVLGLWIIFMIPVPICIAVLYFMRNIENVAVRPELKINYPFHILYMVSTLLMIIALLDSLGTHRLAIFIIGAALFALALFVHMKSRNKVINSALFRNSTFMVCVLLVLLFQYATNGVENTVSQIFQLGDFTVNIFGTAVSAAAVAAALVSFKPAIQVIISPIIAKHYRERDQRMQSLIGFALTLISSVLALIAVKAGAGIGTLVAIFSIYILHAFAASYFTPYNKKVMLISVSKEDVNAASSLSSAIGTMSSILATLTLVNIVGGCSTFDSYVSSASYVFLIVVAVSLIGTFVAFKMMKRPNAEA